jgi:hypothetical protein
VFQLAAELEAARDWYVGLVGEGEWREALQQARQPRAFLSNVHAVAAAHVLRRPVR